MVPALGEHLHGHIFGDHVILDQGAQEFVLRLAGSGEAHLDLLETDLHQQLEELQLFIQTHGHDQALVAVPQIHTAPGGGLFNVILVHPAVLGLGRVIVADLILGNVHHKTIAPCFVLSAGANADKKALASQGSLPLRDEGHIFM